MIGADGMARERGNDSIPVKCSKFEQLRDQKRQQVDLLTKRQTLHGWIDRLPLEFIIDQIDEAIYDSGVAGFAPQSALEAEICLLLEDAGEALRLLDGDRTLWINPKHREPTVGRLVPGSRSPR